MPGGLFQRLNPNTTMGYYEFFVYNCCKQTIDHKIMNDEVKDDKYKKSSVLHPSLHLPLTMLLGSRFCFSLLLSLFCPLLLCAYMICM